MNKCDIASLSCFLWITMHSYSYISLSIILTSLLQLQMHAHSQQCVLSSSLLTTIGYMTDIDCRTDFEHSRLTSTTHLLSLHTHSWDARGSCLVWLYSLLCNWKGSTPTDEKNLAKTPRSWLTWSQASRAVASIEGGRRTVLCPHSPLQVQFAVSRTCWLTPRLGKPICYQW